MTRLDNDLISRKALLEAIKNNGTVSMSDATKVSECVYYDDVIDIITNAPTIESEASSQADSGEAVACEFGKSVGMPEYSCVKQCQYSNTSPPKREWRELTDEQIESIALNNKFWHGFNNDKFDWMRFSMAFQAKLKEVNYG